VYQSPAVPRARRNSTSSSSSRYGASQRQRLSENHPPLVPSGSDPLPLDHIGRSFRRDHAPSGSNKGHDYRSSPPQRHEELITDDGRSLEQGGACDHETSHECTSSPPGSTTGDDCSVHSLAFSETEAESRLRGSEYCSSSEDHSRTYRSSKDSNNRTVQKQNLTASLSGNGFDKWSQHVVAFFHFGIFSGTSNVLYAAALSQIFVELM
jgi:hypothetical protein